MQNFAGKNAIVHSMENEFKQMLSTISHIVITETITETYVKLASNFKEHYKNHQTSFHCTNRGNETELSKHVWTPKNLFK